MKKIRNNIFETNSSSCHVLVTGICSYPRKSKVNPQIVDVEDTFITTAEKIDYVYTLIMVKEHYDAKESEEESGNYDHNFDVCDKGDDDFYNICKNTIEEFKVELNSILKDLGEKELSFGLEKEFEFYNYVGVGSEAIKKIGLTEFIMNDKYSIQIVDAEEICC